LLQSLNVRLGTGEDGIVTNQHFLIVDDKDKLVYTILMGLPFLEAVGGTLDIKNNHFSVQRDKRTTMSHPITRRGGRGKAALVTTGGWKTSEEELSSGYLWDGTDNHGDWDLSRLWNWDDFARSPDSG
jgi:hypothetical protein